MAYTIHKSDGTLITIADNAIDTAFYNPIGGSLAGVAPGLGVGTQLVGRNTIDYGSAIAQNFVQLTENFASATGTFPSDTTALQGQLWFDKTIGELYVRTTSATTGGLANWRKVVTVDSAGTSSIPTVNPTTPHDGDIQVLTSPSLSISIYGNGVWNQVFPAVYS